MDWTGSKHLEGLRNELKTDVSFNMTKEDCDTVNLDELIDEDIGNS